LECGAVVLHELLERAWLPVQDPLDFGARLVTRNFGICHRGGERFDHPSGQSEALQLLNEFIHRHVLVSDRPTEHTGNNGRLRWAVKQFCAIEVVSVSGMPLLGESSDSHGRDVPRIDERDALGGRAVGESALFICSALPKRFCMK
jgi:hypothetical protein